MAQVNAAIHVNNKYINTQIHKYVDIWPAINARTDWINNAAQYSTSHYSASRFWAGGHLRMWGTATPGRIICHAPQFAVGGADVQLQVKHWPSLPREAT